MTFKKLDKRRKVYFVIFLVLGSMDLSLAVFTKDVAMAGLGFLSLLECCTLFNMQEKDDLIDSYAEMFETSMKLHRQNLKTISKAIKENNPTRLKYVADAIDSYYGKEEDDDSNKG